MTHYEYRMIAGIVWTAARAVATVTTELWLARDAVERGDEDAATRHADAVVSTNRFIVERAEHYTRAGED